MKSITIYHKNAHEIIEIVHQIKQHGWVAGVDFDWAYHKATYEFGDNAGVTPKHAIFNFYKEEYSTYFALRWA